MTNTARTQDGADDTQGGGGGLTQNAYDPTQNASNDDEEYGLVPLGAVLHDIEAERKAREWDLEISRAFVDLARVGVGDKLHKRDAPLLKPALELWEEPDVEVIDIVDGLVPEMGLTVQSSDPKTGKTWIEEEIAVSIATGTKAFGSFDTMAGPVALFLFEDSRAATRTRLGAIARGKGLTREQALADVHLVCRPFFDLLSPDDMAWVVASVRALPIAPVAIFFDPLRDAHTGDEVDDMDRVSRALRALIKTLNCAVFVTHHNRKSSSNPKKDGQAGDEMRGGGELRGRLDAGVYPKLTGGDQVNTFELNVKTDKRDGQKQAPFTLKLEIEDENKRAVNVRWTVVRDGKESVTTDEQRVRSALLAMNEEHPASHFALEAIAKRAGIRKAAASDALAALQQEMKVERGFGGRGFRLQTGEIPLPYGTGENLNDHAGSRRRQKSEVGTDQETQ